MNPQRNPQTMEFLAIEFSVFLFGASLASASIVNNWKLFNNLL